MVALACVVTAAVALQPASLAGASVRVAPPLASSWLQPARLHAARQPQEQQQRRNEQQREGQQQQQQRRDQQQPIAWGSVAAQGALTLLAALALLGGDVRMAHAENELAELAGSKTTAELVDPSCFAKQCKGQMETCSADGDCIKGLACTAKCLGDAQCTVGCFARYNNAALERVLQCTIEDAGCIAIATQEPGGDRLEDAPLPPKALVQATPASMAGRWYKVMGFNPNYDCFECQRNSFATTTSGGGGGGDSRATPAVRESTTDINGGTAAVKVEYAMPRNGRVGQADQTFYSELSEKLEFDAPNARRTAHTEGRMFGLTFWENWYVIGANQPREPEFRLVYYTGKTLQNRYEGAFVYARKPELPTTAMPAIYKLAREAGLEPTQACCIDNSCFAQPVDAVAQPPLFTPVAEAGVLNGAALERAAAAADDSPLAALLAPARRTVNDITELLENPKPFGDDLFARQRPMTEVREYDSNGFRTPGLGAR